MSDMNARYTRVSLMSPPISDILYENPHLTQSRYPIFRTLVLFRTYLLDLINFLFALSSTFLLDILKLKRDIGVIYFHQEIFCVCWCYIFWVCSIFLLTASCYCLWSFSSFTVCVITCIITCTCFRWFLARATGRHFEATCIKISSGFQMRLYSSPKCSCLWTAPADSSPVDSHSPQPSAPPSDLDILIAFCKGNRSCTNYLISKFISYDHLNLTFRQFALSVSSEYTLRSLRKLY